MSTLYLCEKPNQAKDLADAIGVVGRRTGYIEVRGGIVTWAFGHMLEQASPDAYDEKWGGRWTFDVLPMIPPEWKHSVVTNKGQQLKVIRGLLKSAREVVIATDAGREGELIAREILEHCTYRGPVRRFWTSSLVKSDIVKALNSLRPGRETEPLYEAALARTRSDWLYGMNGSRAVTLAVRHSGTAYPVGRVQTATLALVVRREWEIRNFVPQVYYELEATVRSAGGEQFPMFHSPAENERIKSRLEAERLKASAEGAKSPLRVIKKSEKESPPLPYSLPSLQKDANRMLGLSASKTLQQAQALYEAHAITYPRTDCTFLAASQKGEIEETLSRLGQVYEGEVEKLKSMGVTARPSTFDDAKLTDHHAIVPTREAVALPQGTEQLFGLISERYLKTLAPDCHFDRTTVTLDANGVPFKATGKRITQEGFRAIRIISRK